MHSQLLRPYLDHKEKCRVEAEKRKKTTEAFTSNDRAAKRPKIVQQTLSQSIKKEKALVPIQQDTGDKLILDYIVNSLSPLSHVEHPSFVALLEGFAPHISVMSRRTLSRRIDDKQRVMLFDIKQTIADQDFLCTTADAWTGFKNRRSFLGVTCHMLAADLTRKSFALACRFFPGKHSYDRIAKLLSDIHEEYDLSVDKITCCVTDNGSNFVKAFKEFEVEVTLAPDSGDEECTETVDDIEQIDVHDLMESQQLDEESVEDVIVLPRHQRCASHTLNLVGIKAPLAAAKTSAKYRSLMHLTNAKLSALWNKVNRPQSNECIQAVLGCQIVTPVATRWNSFYDARRSLLQHSPAKLDELYTSLQLTVFKDVEIAFMKEDNDVFSHLAQGLDRLQGDMNPESYMGFLYPTLLQLQHTYEQLTTSSGLKYCTPLASAILNDINTRFQNYLTFSDSTQAEALASITHPVFKLRWIKPAHVERMKTLFLNSVKFSAEKAHEQETAMTPATKNDALDSKSLSFFTFMDEGEGVLGGPRMTIHSQAELQALQYLDDPDRTLDSLSRYPLVRNMFRKFNVGLPSSASVERLFSIGGMIGTAKRNRLQPALFEKLLLQRVNNKAVHFT